MTDASHSGEGGPARPAESKTAPGAAPDVDGGVRSDDAQPGTSEAGTRGRDVPTRIPDGEPPAARCAYCDRPFRTERLRDLHVGQVHADECSDAEREAYEDADEAELDDLFFYHIKVVVLIGVLFSVFVIGYTVVLSG